MNPEWIILDHCVVFDESGFKSPNYLPSAVRSRISQRSILETSNLDPGSISCLMFPLSMHLRERIGEICYQDQRAIWKLFLGGIFAKPNILDSGLLLVRTRLCNLMQSPETRNLTAKTLSMICAEVCLSMLQWIRDCTPVTRLSVSQETRMVDMVLALIPLTVSLWIGTVRRVASTSLLA